MKALILLLITALSQPSFSQTVNVQKISVKIDLAIWDCKNTFECASGNVLYSHSVTLELEEQFEIPPVVFYATRYTQNLDPIDKKLFTFDIKIQKDVHSTTNSFQYVVMGTFTDHFEGRISDSHIYLPANQDIGGTIYSISTGPYKDGDKLKKPELKVTFEKGQ